MNKLIYVTSNVIKFRTLKNYLLNHKVDLSLERRSFDFQEIQAENSYEVVYNKIAQVENSIKIPFIVDDTSFYTKKYSGFPGVYTKYINQKLGIAGWKELFSDGDDILITTILGLYLYGEVHIFEGKLKGTLNFDYKKTFSRVNPLNDFIIPQGQSRILAECLKDKTFKDNRAKAFKKVTDFIDKSESSYDSKKIAEKWNIRAEKWNDCLHDQKYFVNYEDGYERFLEFARGIISKKRNISVLDIGCGTGAVTQFVYKIADPKYILGIDISENMISNAKRLNAKKIDFIKEDIFELGDGEFDLITSRGILVSDIPKVQVLDFFEKVNSLLKEGGIFIFDFLQKTDNENEALNKAEHVKTVFNLEQMTSIFEEVGLEILDFNIRDGMSRVGIIAVTKI